jgi:hypothetical protein
MLAAAKMTTNKKSPCAETIASLRFKSARA